MAQPASRAGGWALGGTVGGGHRLVQRYVVAVSMAADVSQEGALHLRLASPSEIELLNAIDDDASTLYGEHGVPMDLGADHVFARAEVKRWLRSAQLGRAFPGAR